MHKEATKDQNKAKGVSKEIIIENKKVQGSGRDEKFYVRNNE